MKLKMEKPKNETKHPSQLTWWEYVVGKVQADAEAKAKAGEPLGQNVVPAEGWTPAEYAGGCSLMAA
jgi:hypothetical protein